MVELRGKVAIVTGSTRGIGRAIAESLWRAGASVVVSGRTAATAEALAAKWGPRALAVACDVREPAACARLVERAVGHFGGLDILVNNAGIGVFAPVRELTPELWRAVIATNLDSLFYCCHAALPALMARGESWIINIGSLAGRNWFPKGGAYCASKAGLNAFTEALMQEVRYDNIRVSEVMPGSVDTAFGGSRSAPSEWKLAPEDVAQVVVDLIAHDSRSLPSRVEMRPSRPPRK